MSRIKISPLLRRLEILKLLQDNPMRTVKIEKHFRSPDSEVSDPRTIQADLVDLRDGIDVFGTIVKITEETRGHSIKHYKSTVYPIFQL